MKMMFPFACKVRVCAPDPPFWILLDTMISPAPSAVSVMSPPSTCMRPDCVFLTPEIRPSKVDLPTPSGPISPARQPSGIETVMLSPSQRLAVIEFHGREILVAATRAGLTRLAEAPAREVVS